MTIVATLFLSVSVPGLSMLTPETVHADSPHYRGWDHLAKRLQKMGVSKSLLKKTYGDKRMPRYNLITFKMDPAEPKDIYRVFRKPEKIQKAKAHLSKYRRTYDSIEQKYGVHREVVAAILLVETQYGRITGRSGIFNRLSRLANINDPENVKRNYKRLKEEDPELTFEMVQKRADYVADMFINEIPAIFTICERYGYNPFNLKGSFAGAFGIPQFLPSSYVKFAVDGNGDGKTSLYQMEDAIHSTANYLKQHGWNQDLKTSKAKKEIVWHYNHSQPYVDTVVGIAETLG